MKLRKELKQLTQKNERYSPFANELDALAKSSSVASGDRVY